MYKEFLHIQKKKANNINRNLRKDMNRHVSEPKKSYITCILPGRKAGKGSADRGALLEVRQSSSWGSGDSVHTERNIRKYSPRSPGYVDFSGKELSIHTQESDTTTK